jgi:quercetin dioxygenase-like cupin family protein
MIQSTVDRAVNPSDETIRLGPLVIRFLVAGDDSHGSAAMFECTVPAGEKLRAPAHSHDAFEETIYGLEGVLTWTVDGQPIDVAPGQALCIPRGAVHRFDNLGQQHARVLITASPAVFGPEYFREAAAAMDAAAGGPPDPARMADIMRRHGLTPALPGS